MHKIDTLKSQGGLERVERSAEIDNVLKISRISPGVIK